MSYYVYYDYNMVLNWIYLTKINNLGQYWLISLLWLATLVNKCSLVTFVTKFTKYDSQSTIFFNFNFSLT